MIAPLLDAVLALTDLDSYMPDPLVMMAAEPGDVLDPVVEVSYRTVVDRAQPRCAPHRPPGPACILCSRQGRLCRGHDR